MAHYDCNVCGTYGCTSCGPVRSKVARPVSEKPEVNKEDSSCDTCGSNHNPGSFCENSIGKVELFPRRKYEATRPESPEFTRYKMKCLAKVHALSSADNKSYLPKTPVEAEEWEPHNWVIDAMTDAFKHGRNESEHEGQSDVQSIDNSQDAKTLYLRSVKWLQENAPEELNQVKRDQHYSTQINVLERMIKHFAGWGIGKRLLIEERDRLVEERAGLNEHCKPLLK